MQSTQQVPRFSQYTKQPPNSQPQGHPISYNQILSSIESQLSRRIINVNKTKQIGQILYNQLNTDILRLKSNCHVLEKLCKVEDGGDGHGQYREGGGGEGQMGWCQDEVGGGDVWRELGGFLGRVGRLERRFCSQGQWLWQEYRKYRDNSNLINIDNEFNDFINNSYQKYNARVSKQLLPTLSKLLNEINQIKTPALPTLDQSQPQSALQSYPQMIQLLSRFRSLLSSQYQQLLSPKHSSEEECKSAVIFLSYLNNLFAQVKHAICDIHANDKKNTEIDNDGPQLCLLTRMYLHAGWVRDKLMLILRRVYLKFVRNEECRGWPQSVWQSQNIVANNENKIEAQDTPPKKIPKKQPLLIPFTPPTYHQLQHQISMYQQLQSLSLPQGHLYKTQLQNQYKLSKQIQSNKSVQQLKKIYQQMNKMYQKQIRKIQDIFHVCKVLCFQDVERLQVELLRFVEDCVRKWEAVGMVLKGLGSVQQIAGLEEELGQVQDRQRRYRHSDQRQRQRQRQRQEDRCRQAQLACIHLSQISNGISSKIKTIKQQKIFEQTSLESYLIQKMKICHELRRKYDKLAFPKKNNPPPIIIPKRKSSIKLGQEMKIQIEQQKQRAQSKISVHVSYSEQSDDATEYLQKISLYISAVQQFVDMELRDKFTGLQLLLALVQPTTKSRNKLISSMTTLNKIKQQNQRISIPNTISMPLSSISSPSTSSSLHSQYQSHKSNMQIMQKLFAMCLSPLSSSLTTVCNECLNFQYQDWIQKIGVFQQFLNNLEVRYKDLQALQANKITIFFGPVLKIVKEFSGVLQILIDIVTEIGYFYKQIKKVTAARSHTKKSINLLSNQDLDYMTLISQFRHKMLQQISQIDKFSNISKNARTYLKQLFTNFHQQFTRAYPQPQQSLQELIKLVQISINLKQNEQSIKQALEESIKNRKLQNISDLVQIKDICEELLQLREEISHVERQFDGIVVDLGSIEEVRRIVNRFKWHFLLASAVINAFDNFDKRRQSKSKIKNIEQQSLNERTMPLYNKFMKVFNQIYS